MDLAKIAGEPDEINRTLPSGIIVKCYTEIGEISAWGKISVDAREVINIDAQHATHIVVISTTTGGDYPQEGISTIGYKDLEKLCYTIEYMKNVNPSSTKFNMIEAEISIEEFRLTVFNTSKGKMMFSVSANSVGVHMELSRIEELKKLLIKAKDTINECKQY